MKFTFYNPVKIFFEDNCVRNHKTIFRNSGSKAMIVTGKSSAIKCGAQEDVEMVLNDLDIPYLIFNKIENNPSMESVEEASKIAKKEGVDYIIGIGGGSPIDAAKAIAVLAANEIVTQDLFLNQFDKALPVIAIPTTAGTGSETTPYSVLLSKEKETKLSFGNELTFPKYALLDAKYTYSLNLEFTISTAVDAFTHVFEGYLANRSTSLSEQFSLEGIRKFGECIPEMLRGNFSSEIREKLLYVSTLGGMVIAMTGVTIAHGMGYCYTYFKGIPHGRANGLLMAPYIQYNYPVSKEKIDRSMKLMNYKNVDTFLNDLKILVGTAPKLTVEEIGKYTELTLMQKGSITNTPNPLDRKKIYRLWERC